MDLHEYLEANILKAKDGQDKVVFEQISTLNDAQLLTLLTMLSFIIAAKVDSSPALVLYETSLYMPTTIYSEEVRRMADQN